MNDYFCKKNKKRENTNMISPLLLAGISAGMQGLSTLLGTRAAARQNKKIEKQNEADLKRAEAERKEAGDNYLDTSEGKALSNIAAEQLQEASQIANGQSIRSGESNAQRLARQQNAAKNYANVIRQLAANSLNYKRYNDNILQQARNRYAANLNAMQSAKAQSDVNAGVGVANAIGNSTQAAIGLQALDELNGNSPAAKINNTAADSVNIPIPSAPQYNSNSLLNNWDDILKNKRSRVTLR